MTIQIAVESPQEHVRNVAIMLAHSQIDEDTGNRVLPPAEYYAIQARLMRVATQLEVRAVLWGNICKS
jgi:hypothetical protein